MSKYRSILTQYHKVSTSTNLYWPSTITYQPVPPSTDPVPPSTNQYHSILTRYHQVSTNTNLYIFCFGITDSCTVYPGSCFIAVTTLNCCWCQTWIVLLLTAAQTSVLAGWAHTDSPVWQSFCLNQNAKSPLSRSDTPLSHFFPVTVYNVVHHKNLKLKGVPKQMRMLLEPRCTRLTTSC